MGFFGGGGWRHHNICHISQMEGVKWIWVNHQKMNAIFKLLHWHENDIKTTSNKEREKYDCHKNYLAPFNIERKQMLL